jgi:hypothetical protein
MMHNKKYLVLKPFTETKTAMTVRRKEAALGHLHFAFFSLCSAVCGAMVEIRIGGRACHVVQQGVWEGHGASVQRSQRDGA